MIDKGGNEQMTALIANSFWTPILALDRLNSWVRSEKFNSLQSTLRRTIYWTKTHAILELSKQHRIAMRRVMVKLPCRKCDGRGTFCHWSWFDGSGEPCWGCNATGIATLKFIETQIGSIRWHTPQKEWWSSSLDVYVPFPSYYDRNDDFGYALADDWQPNQPGRPLSREEAERDMLIVFRRWPRDVVFILDHYYDAKLEYSHRSPNMRAAEKWIRDLFANGRSPTPARNLGFYG